MNRDTRIVILGGGPAGLGAAFWLAVRGFEPVVLEARSSVGGNAGSFQLHGLPVDYGSHRLHPATDPEILADLRTLLGSDLLERRRHGRILLRDRWIHFPLRPLNLLSSAPPSFLLGASRDALGAPFRGTGRGERSQATFADILWDGLGPTICRDFYFPYARKIWGMEPEEISPTQARRRVGARSLGKLVRRVLPGGRTGAGGKNTFFYPRHGYGQISRALADAAEDRGARILLDAPARRIERSPDEDLHGDPREILVTFGPPRDQQTVPCHHLWSTIPLGLLARLMSPPPPEDVRTAAGSLGQRAMVLVYLVLETHRFTEFDAHSLPAPEIPFTRISEPKNYSGREMPEGKTVLCAELPCSTDDALWTWTDEDLGELVAQGLARAGLPLRAPVLEVATRRLPSAYPLYRVGYQKHLDLIDGWIRSLPGILTFGRQGLFAHDNTHHALFMARSATDCLEEDGGFDRERWAGYRKIFGTHVVQD